MAESFSVRDVRAGLKAKGFKCKSEVREDGLLIHLRDRNAVFISMPDSDTFAVDVKEKGEWTIVVEKGELETVVKVAGEQISRLSQS